MRFGSTYNPRSRDAAKQIHDVGRACLRSYRSLSSISIRQGKQEWPIKPKYHVAGLFLMHLFGGLKSNILFLDSTLPSSNKIINLPLKGAPKNFVFCETNKLNSTSCVYHQLVTPENIFGLLINFFGRPYLIRSNEALLHICRDTLRFRALTAYSAGWLAKSRIPQISIYLKRVVDIWVFPEIMVPPNHPF